MKCSYFLPLNQFTTSSQGRLTPRVHTPCSDSRCSCWSCFSVMASSRKSSTFIDPGFIDFTATVNLFFHVPKIGNDEQKNISQTLTLKTIRDQSLWCQWFTEYILMCAIRDLWPSCRKFSKSLKAIGRFIHSWRLSLLDDSRPNVITVYYSYPPWRMCVDTEASSCCHGVIQIHEIEYMQRVTLNWWRLKRGMKQRLTSLVTRDFMTIDQVLINPDESNRSTKWRNNFTHLSHTLSTLTLYICPDHIGGETWFPTGDTGYPGAGSAITTGSTCWVSHSSLWAYGFI